MVRFAEIVQIGGDHLLVTQLAPQPQALPKPLDRFRQVSRRHGQQPEAVQRMGFARLVTELPKEAQGLLKLRLRTRIVTLELSNQAEAHERASNARRVSHTPPGIQAFLVTGTSSLQMALLAGNLAKTRQCPGDPL